MKPFFTWKDITENIQEHWTTLGKKEWDVSLIIWNSLQPLYVERKGLEMPYTQIVLGMTYVLKDRDLLVMAPRLRQPAVFYLGKDLNERKVPTNKWDLSTGRMDFRQLPYKQVDNLMSFVSSE